MDMGFLEELGIMDYSGMARFGTLYLLWMAVTYKKRTMIDVDKTPAPEADDSPPGHWIIRERPGLATNLALSTSLMSKDADPLFKELFNARMVNSYNTTMEVFPDQVAMQSPSFPLELLPIAQNFVSSQNLDIVSAIASIGSGALGGALIGNSVFPGWGALIGGVGGGVLGALPLIF